jgi:pimeloyl-ACP methyl ester carboxylesterase
MPLMSRLARASAAGLAVALLAGPLAIPAEAATAKTSAAEKRRVDRVATPELKWYTCYVWAQCATAKVPLDYDRPHGRQVEVALLRVKARDQKHKIGSLFVNPGGPGASATQFALLSPLFLSDSLLSRFDIVGMDPRGVGFSDTAACFTSAGKQTSALKGMQSIFPVGKKEERAYLRSAKKLGQACSTTGRPLTGSMSTAEVARDMEVMRRAVGDKKLNYLGFSYGSAIGEYYADMFPDRFRTIAIDGVLNPRSWVGSDKTGNVVQDVRLNSAGGAYKAFVVIMKRCKAAGTKRCAFAAGDPLKRFGYLTARLKRDPITIPVPLLGITVKITYASFIGDVLDALYSPTAGDDVTQLAADMTVLTSLSSTATQLAAARTRYAKHIRGRLARSFPYDNSIDAYASIMCTDGLHPKDASKWPAYAAAADRKAPYFGRAWAWASVQCARNTWTVRDEDAYTGPFTKRTKNTVLVVGSYWDPATNYRDAVQTARMMPNSRLLSSNNWGHTAYGTSPCATGAIDRYLLTKKAPAKGASCKGTDQPFTGAPASSPVLDLSAASVSSLMAQGLPAAGTPKMLPPVARR